ncbi:uncharacterized protein LOC111309918 [Durio zibethinus]|uniref:Uncharacterized protein LOC111309918 n=1 Tax=Durio zibethinus TaxID=66656 RepID=A0A6P6AII5_DURZI|nr:uncharacterized protein LOC111309918 [Durio zibethinus]
MPRRTFNGNISNSLSEEQAYALYNEMAPTVGRLTIKYNSKKDKDENINEDSDEDIDEGTDEDIDKDTNEDSAKHGTGVVIDDEGFALTLYELVSKTGSSIFISFDGSEEQYEAKICKSEELKRQKLALIKVELKNGNLLESANISEDEIFVGQDIFCIQNAFPSKGLGYQISYVSSLLRNFNDIDRLFRDQFLECDMETNVIQTGNLGLCSSEDSLEAGRGAPLFDSGGNVMGLLAFEYNRYDFAIHCQKEKILFAIEEAKRASV